MLIPSGPILFDNQLAFMTFTDNERQILYSQNQILSLLDPENADHYKMSMVILMNGYGREYPEVYDIYHDIYSADVCAETVDILNMYRRINNSYAGLSDEEKSSLDMSKIKFEGFDGNNDPHLSYTEFMINKQNKWDELKNMYLNSHDSLSIRKYRQMIAAFRERLGPSMHKDLSFEDLKYLIDSV